MAEEAKANEVQDALPARIDVEPLKPLHGRIISGMQLSIAAQKRIAARFEEKLGVPVKLICRVDKKELGGVRVELDGYSYNGTARGQLREIYRYLLKTEEGGSNHA
ncbi:MAG: F0F1 ATP synthase subunit delta [Clostridia bacterium]